MSDAWCYRHGQGLRLVVQVQPNASVSAVLGEAAGALRLRLKAPPVEGKANEALIRLIAELLGVARRDVSIAHGLSSRHKRVDVLTDLSPEQVRTLLLPGHDALTQ